MQVYEHVYMCEKGKPPNYMYMYAGDFTQKQVTGTL